MIIFSLKYLIYINFNKNKHIHPQSPIPNPHFVSLSNILVKITNYKNNG